MEELKARKDAQARQRMTSGVQPMVYTTNSVSANQQAQWTASYCGPAAVTEALGQKGVGTDQNSMLSLLQTDSNNGTAWYSVYINVPNASGYPVPDAQNNKVGSNWYVPVAVPYTPGSQD